MVGSYLIDWYRFYQDYNISIFWSVESWIDFKCNFAPILNTHEYFCCKISSFFCFVIQWNKIIVEIYMCKL